MVKFSFRRCYDEGWRTGVEVQNAASITPVIVFCRRIYTQRTMKDVLEGTATKVFRSDILMNKES